MINVVTAPATALVTTSEAKTALLVDHSQDDTLIDRLIAAATTEVEALAARSLVTRTIDQILTGWPSDNVIRLEYPPIQSITSIVYYDADNTAHTLPASDYVAVLDVQPPLIVLANGAVWPATELRPVYPIRVRTVAGYGTAAAVPALYKQAVLGLVAVDYEHRESMSVAGEAQRDRILASLKLDWGWST